LKKDKTENKKKTGPLTAFNVHFPRPDALCSSAAIQYLPNASSPEK
jgi:hypothetical protein